jgi:hypothetical protein
MSQPAVHLNNIRVPKHDTAYLAELVAELHLRKEIGFTVELRGEFWEVELSSC